MDRMLVVVSSRQYTLFATRRTINAPHSDSHHAIVGEGDTMRMLVRSSVT